MPLSLRNNLAPAPRLVQGLWPRYRGGSGGQQAAACQIADNGIGFEQKYAERIFGVFQRLHGRGEYAGTGIGLAACAKIVDRHEGSITAIGQPGRGATFLVNLPSKHRVQEEESPWAAPARSVS